MDNPSQHTTSMIDPTVLALVAKGDQQAFSTLYDHSSRLLFTLAIRILGSREDASELLRDVYVDVWRKVSRYDVGRGTPVVQSFGQAALPNRAVPDAAGPRSRM